MPGQVPPCLGRSPASEAPATQLTWWHLPPWEAAEKAEMRILADDLTGDKTHQGKACACLVHRGIELTNKYFLNE